MRAQRIKTGLHRLAVTVAALLPTLLFFAASIAWAWERALPEAAFSPRDTAHGFEWRGYLYFSNGWAHDGVAKRDLWRSRDGLSWELVNGNTPYDAYSGIAVMGGAIYAANRTVWRSLDGAAWTQIGTTPIENESALPYLRSFDGRLWLFAVAGLWSSSDGVTWRPEPLPTELINRAAHGVIVFRDALWIAGGRVKVANHPPEVGYPGMTSFNDVWRKDGKSWKRMVATAPWSPRMWPGVVVHKGRLYLLGGYSNRSNLNLGDTWFTEDGTNWKLLNFAEAFTPRHWPTVFSLGDDIILMAGNAWPVQNDVWRLEIPK